MLVGVEYSSQTAGDACEVLLQSLKQEFFFLQGGFGGEVSVVGTCSSRESPFPYLLVGSEEVSEVKQTVVGDEHLLGSVPVLLPHAVHSRGHAPVMLQCLFVPHVIVDRLQAHCQFGFGSHFLIFAAIVLLISHDGFQGSLSYVPCIVADGLGVNHPL